MNRSLRILKILAIAAIFSTHYFASASAINPGDMFISVATPGAGAVYQIDQAGNVSIFASGLDAPAGLAFTPDGQLFVAEVASGEVTNITAGGNFSGAAAHAHGFGFNTIKNILTDTNGRILVANRAQGTVVDVTNGGSASTQPIFASGLSGTRDVFQTSNGTIYAVEEFSGEVTDVTAGGDFTFAQAFASGFNSPYALAESPDHELFIVEVQTGNVYNITDGNIGVTLFAFGLGITDEIIFSPAGSFLAVQEFDGSIADISAGGGGPFPLFLSGLGMFPQQIAFAPPVPLPGAGWLLFSGLVVLLTRSKSSRQLQSA